MLIKYLSFSALGCRTDGLVGGSCKWNINRKLQPENSTMDTSLIKQLARWPRVFFTIFEDVVLLLHQVIVHLTGGLGDLTGWLTDSPLEIWGEWHHVRVKREKEKEWNIHYVMHTRKNTQLVFACWQVSWE